MIKKLEICLLSKFLKIKLNNFFRKSLDSSNGLKSIQEKNWEPATSTGIQMKKNSIAGLLSFRLNKISSISSSFAYTSGLDSSGNNHGTSPLSVTNLTGQTKTMQKDILTSNSSSYLDKLTINGNKLTEKEHQLYNCGEDYMTFDCSNNKDFQQASTNSVERAKVSKPNSDVNFSGSPMRRRFKNNIFNNLEISGSSNCIVKSDSQTKISDPKDYVIMDENISATLYRSKFY